MKADCEVCKRLKGDKFDSNDCKDCLPELMDENKDAARVYLLCRDQAIMAPMGGPVALNHMAVHEAMRLYEVEDRRGCFEKVLKVFQHFLEKSREENES